MPWPDRQSGEIVWSNSEMNSGYVTLLLDGDRLIVSTNGYIYCLDPLTGQILWNNPLRVTAAAVSDIPHFRPRAEFAGVDPPSSGSRNGEGVRP